MQISRTCTGGRGRKGRHINARCANGQDDGQEQWAENCSCKGPDGRFCGPRASLASLLSESESRQIMSECAVFQQNFIYQNRRQAKSGPWAAVC